MALENITQEQGKSQEKPARRRLMTRRRFLGAVGLGAAAIGATSIYRGLNQDSYSTSVQNHAYCAEIKRERKDIEYALIFDRNIPSDWVAMVNNALFVEKGFWNTLPRGLSDKELYDRFMKSPMMIVSTMKYTGTGKLTGRNGLTTSDQDTLERYMEDVTRFKGMAAPSLDPDAKFEDKDVEVIECVVKREFQKSPLVTKLDRPMTSWGKTIAKAGTHYEYPAGSKVICKSEPGKMSMEIWVNTNRNPSAEPKYVKLPEVSFTGEEFEAFDRLSRFRMLYPVIIPMFKDKEAPFNIVYREYLRRENVESQAESKKAKDNVKKEDKKPEKTEPKRFKRLSRFISGNEEN